MTNNRYCVRQSPPRTTIRMTHHNHDQPYWQPIKTTTNRYYKQPPKQTTAMTITNNCHDEQPPQQTTAITKRSCDKLSKRQITAMMCNVHNNKKPPQRPTIMANWQGWAPRYFTFWTHRSFKTRYVLLRSFFEFLATYETQKNDALFS